MAANINIPSVDYNSYFGTINKVVWFDVTDNYNYFDVTLNVDRLQFYDAKLSIINLGTGAIQWEQTVAKSTNPTPASITTRVLNTPGLGSPVYGLFNKGQ